MCRSRSLPLRRPLLALVVALALLAPLVDVSPAVAQPGDPPAAPPAAASPADAWRAVTFGATIETYYQYNGNRPPDRVLALRAYDTRSNSFSLQQAAFVIDAAPDVQAQRRYGLRVDLQFGQATETVQGSAANEPRPDIYRHLWQAFGSYVFDLGPSGLQVDAGKFASMLGYETNYAKDNQAFSRSYLFNFLPFYHTGVRTTFALNPRVTLLHMLTNGIQQSEDFNDFKSQQVAAIVKPTDRLTWTANYYVGQEQPDGGEPGGPDGWFHVVDSYVTFTPTAAWSLGADVNRVSNAVVSGGPALVEQGVAGYARYQATARSALGVRYERMHDDGLFAGVAQRLQETTLTAEWKPADGFIVRAEYRRDWSNVAFFPGRSGGADRRRDQHTALLSGTWVIGSRGGTW